MNSGQLLQCPSCIQSGKTQYLGSVQPNGDLIVLRFHHGTTIIKAESYSLGCGCGFSFSVSGTAITEVYQ